MRAALGGQDEAFALSREWNVALMTNASDLLAEADMLFDGKRYARAVALAHFAMEEMGKVVSLISLAVESAIGNEPAWAAAEKAWSSHDTKFQLFHMIDLVTQASTAKALSANLELHASARLFQILCQCSQAWPWREQRRISRWCDSAT